MRHIKYLVISLVVLSLVALFTKQSEGWGFWGHKRINRIAVFTLPPQMLTLFKENIEYITEHAVDPDKRRYSSPDEAPRHYIDIDRYGIYPNYDLPRKWRDAVMKYSEDTLKAHGIVPWHIQNMMFRLKEAFEKKNKSRILQTAAELGHYVADAHVPLHCTRNYNGQLTGQNGIHAFWESRIPELFGDNYDYFVGKATYIDNTEEFIWNFVMESASQADSVLSIERDLSKQFSDDKKYSFEQRGNAMVRVYSAEFSDAYTKALNNMIERKMRKSILNLGSIWYTCWVNAGSPDLQNLKYTEPTPEEITEMNALENSWKGGKMLGRDHEDH